jgi:signal transduction histidine kinase
MAIPPGSEQSLSRIFSCVFDLTALVEAEKKLKAYQEHLEDMVSERTTQLNIAYKNLFIESQKREHAQTMLKKQYIKEHRLRNQIEAQMEKRLLFMRTLMHELKTPLTPLLGASDSLLGDLPEGPLLKQARCINEGAVRLNKRINELFDQTKAEMSILNINRHNVNLKILLTEVAEAMETKVVSKDLTLKLDLPDSLPMIWADEERIHQVVMNLLENSFKFTPAGGTITLRARLHNGNEVVEIEDTGIGIERSKRKGLFQPYYITRDKNDAKIGLGLGLSLCKTLIELHGGKIWLRSQKGKGSMFTFSIPMNIKDHDNPK